MNPAEIRNAAMEEAAQKADRCAEIHRELAGDVARSCGGRLIRLGDVGAADPEHTWVSGLFSDFAREIRALKEQEPTT